MNDKYSSLKFFLFCVGGIIFNLGFPRLVKEFVDTPLYLDTGGTILVSALGGGVPGVTVGFLTNVFASIINNLTKIFGDEPNAIVILDFTDVYFSFVNVVIAIVTSFLAHRGYYNSFVKVIMTIPLTVFLTTLSNMTIEFFLGYTNEVLFLSDLETNFVPNFFLETFDKGFMILAVYFALKFVPSSVGKTFHSVGKRQATLPDNIFKEVRGKFFQLSSLRTKMMVMLMLVMVLIAVAVSLVGYMLYIDIALKDRIKIAEGLTTMVVSEVNPNRVDDYLAQGRAAEGYNEMARNLYRIRSSNSDVEFIYVYKIEKDGCHVVFELETSDMRAAIPGSVVPLKKSFREHLPALLARKPIRPVITNDFYGQLLTVCKPVYNHKGKCVCYAAIDFSMGLVYEYGRNFVFQIFALLTSMFIVIFAWEIELIDNNLILPINTMAWCAKKFSYSDEEARKENIRLIQSLNIRTGDEIEHLYTSLVGSAETDMQNFHDLREAEIKVGVMNELAHKDSLTGIKNKTAYVELTDKLDKKISEGNAEFSIVMIDVNYLKKVNDTYGHERGNEYLINACHLACRIFGEENVFRVGGDEFVAVLVDDEVADCQKRVEQINAEIKKFRANDKIEPWKKVSAAVGTGFYRKGVDKTCDEVFKRADAQMYENKLAMKATRTD